MVVPGYFSTGQFYPRTTSTRPTPPPVLGRELLAKVEEVVVPPWFAWAVKHLDIDAADKTRLVELAERTAEARRGDPSEFVDALNRLRRSGRAGGPVPYPP
jgi:hypothetical protein